MQIGKFNTPIWDDDPTWVTPPHLSSDQSCDVCVVGLGASGLAAVLEIVKSGFKVIGIDAIDVAAGAAGRNGGFLLAGLADFYHDSVKSLGRDKALKIYRETITELEKTFEEYPECTKRTGSLRIAASQQELEDCKKQMHFLQKDNLPCQWYSGPEGEGLLFPYDGVMNPMRRAQAMARKAMAAGAVLHGNTKAIQIKGWEVKVQNGCKITCKRVIVAVDGNLEKVIQELAPKVKTTRLQMLSTAPTTDVSYSFANYRRDGYDYWQQLSDGRIVFGGCRDFYSKFEWQAANEPDEKVQSKLEEFLRTHIGTQAPITHRWAGMVAYTRNGDPIYQEIRPNVMVIGAYSGTGNILGTIYGKKAANWAIKKLQARSKL